MPKSNNIDYFLLNEQSLNQSVVESNELPVVQMLKRSYSNMSSNGSSFKLNSTNHVQFKKMCTQSSSSINNELSKTNPLYFNNTSPDYYSSYPPYSSDRIQRTNSYYSQLDSSYSHAIDLTSTYNNDLIKSTLYLDQWINEKKFNLTNSSLSN